MALQNGINFMLESKSDEIITQDMTLTKIKYRSLDCSLRSEV